MFKFFGKIETMKIIVDERGLYSVWNNGRQLTNVSFTKNVPQPYAVAGWLVRLENCVKADVMGSI